MLERAAVIVANWQYAMPVPQEHHVPGSAGTLELVEDQQNLLEAKVWWKSWKAASTICTISSLRHAARDANQQETGG